MASNKPGLAKYASHRGPFGHEPIAEQIAFWTRDLQSDTRAFEAAKADGDVRVMRLTRKYIKESVAKLAALGVTAQGVN